jgi:RNA polymerase sigma-70 factor (ECF subfamily)
MLILKDLLGWSARDIADLLRTTVPSVTSALQRARRTLRTHMPERTAWPSLVPSNTERALLRRLLAAIARADASELAELLLGADGRLVSSEH